MNKIFLIVFTMFLFIFSGCSSFSESDVHFESDIAGLNETVINYNSLGLDEAYDAYCQLGKKTVVSLDIESEITNEELLDYMNELIEKKDFLSLSMLSYRLKLSGYEVSSLRDVYFEMVSERSDLVRELGYMSVSEISEKILTENLSSDEIGIHLYYLGFAYILDGNFEMASKYYGCSARVYNNPYALYRNAKLYQYGTDAIKEQLPENVIIENTIEVNHTQAYFYITISEMIDIIYGYDLFNAGTNLGWNAIAMADSYANKDYGIDIDSVMNNANGYILKIFPQINEPILVKNFEDNFNLSYSKENLFVDLNYTYDKEFYEDEYFSVEYDGLWDVEGFSSSEFVEVSFYEPKSYAKSYYPTVFDVVIEKVSDNMTIDDFKDSIVEAVENNYLDEVTVIYHWIDFNGYDAYLINMSTKFMNYDVIVFQDEEHSYLFSFFTNDKNHYIKYKNLREDFFSSVEIK